MRGAAAGSSSGNQAQEALGLPPGARGQGGRKGPDGSEEVPDFKSIRESARDCMKLLERVEDAKEKAAKAINALAERSNTNSRNLRKLFKANLKGNFADARRDIEQQAVLFEQVGEVGGEVSAAAAEK